MTINTEPTWQRILREELEAFEEQRLEDIDAELQRDLTVDRTSGHWLPEPLVSEQIGAIAQWFATSLPVSMTTSSSPVARLRRVPSEIDWQAFAGGGSDGETPALGLDAEGFHWLPTYLAASKDGETSELTLEAREQDANILVPLVTIILDDEVLLPIPEESHYDAERRKLHVVLEGVVPQRYTLDLSRSDRGKVTLQLSTYRPEESNQ